MHFWEEAGCLTHCTYPYEARLRCRNRSALLPSCLCLPSFACLCLCDDRPQAAKPARRTEEGEDEKRRQRGEEDLLIGNCCSWRPYPAAGRKRQDRKRMEEERRRRSYVKKKDKSKRKTKKEKAASLKRRVPQFRLCNDHRHLGDEALIQP